jgi:hypothetical protein
MLWILLLNGTVPSRLSDFSQTCSGILYPYLFYINLFYWFLELLKLPTIIVDLSISPSVLLVLFHEILWSTFGCIHMEDCRIFLKNCWWSLYQYVMFLPHIFQQSYFWSLLLRILIYPLQHYFDRCFFFMK